MAFRDGNPPWSPFFLGGYYSSLWQIVQQAHHPELAEGGRWEGFKKAILLGNQGYINAKVSTQESQ